MDPRLLLVVAGIAGAAALQTRIGDLNAASRTNDFRYTPDPSVMRVVAGAHRSTLADLLWLQALPDMARPFSDRALKKRWLAGATEVVTDLDPSFGTVYAYGAAHLNVVDKNPDAAIKLLTKGISNNADSAGLFVALAMVHYEYKHDKEATIALLEMASRPWVDGIDSLSLAMLAAMKVDEHDDFVAIAVWARTFEEAPNAKARAISEFELWRTKHLIAARATRAFEKRTDPDGDGPLDGAPPKTPADLRDPKLIDPKVFDIVLEGLDFDEKGHPHYARFDELERARRIVQADDVTAAFLEGQGRLPSSDEFFRQFGKMPVPPRGKKWRYADGKLSLADE